MRVARRYARSAFPGYMPPAPGGESLRDTPPYAKSMPCGMLGEQSQGEGALGEIRTEAGDRNRECAPRCILSALPLRSLRPASGIGYPHSQSKPVEASARLGCCRRVWQTREDRWTPSGDRSGAESWGFRLLQRCAAGAARTRHSSILRVVGLRFPLAVRTVFAMLTKRVREN